MPVSHAEQVRAACTVSADIFSPSVQYGCGSHDSMRCDDDVWYVLDLHSVHSLSAIELSGEMYCPVPHVGWSMHVVLRCTFEDW